MLIACAHARVCVCGNRAFRACTHLEDVVGDDQRDGTVTDGVIRPRGGRDVASEAKSKAAAQHHLRAFTCPRRARGMRDGVAMSVAIALQWGMDAVRTCIRLCRTCVVHAAVPCMRLCRACMPVCREDGQSPHTRSFTPGQANSGRGNLRSCASAAERRTRMGSGSDGDDGETAASLHGQTSPVSSW